jgi:hypothetical protein
MEWWGQIPLMQMLDILNLQVRLNPDAVPGLEVKLQQLLLGIPQVADYLMVT